MYPNASNITSPFTDAGRLRDFLTGFAAYQNSNEHKVSCCSSRPWTASIFWSFDAQLLSILFGNLSRLVLLYVFKKIFLWRFYVFIIIWTFFLHLWINRCVQNKTLLRFAKNQIMQIGSGVLNMWAVKCSGLGFLDLPVYIVTYVVYRMVIIVGYYMQPVTVAGIKISKGPNLPFMGHHSSKYKPLATIFVVKVLQETYHKTSDWYFWQHLIFLGRIAVLRT